MGGNLEPNNVALNPTNLESSQAFVLTSGKRHYRTEDRGKTWRHFDLPLSPALVARPLSFHSDPAKYGYILYQGTSCDKKGWGAICHDEVRASTLDPVSVLTIPTDLLHQGSVWRRPKETAHGNLAMPIRAQQQGFQSRCAL
jgi:hypothetical protein